MSSSENKKVSLSEIATIHDSKRIPLNSRERSERRGNIPYYGAQGVIDHIDDHIFEGDYVLIAEDGENLRSKKLPVAFRAKGKFWVNNHSHIIQGNEDWINDYIEAFFNYADISPYITGAAQPKLNKANLLKIKLPFDELTAKEASLLWKLFQRKIELNRKMNETLEQIGRAFFKNYFIDNPEREGWETRTLGEFFPIRTGKKDANFSTADGMYPFFTCSQNNLKAPGYSFDGPALLLAGNGDFSIKFYRGKFEAYQRTYVLMPHNEHFLGLLYFLVSINLGEITGGSRGSVIKFITKGMIEDFKIKMPDDDQLSEVAKQFNDITISIEKNTAQSQTLMRLRDTLLPKLMDGSITI